MNINTMYSMNKLKKKQHKKNKMLLIRTMWKRETIFELNDYYEDDDNNLTTIINDKLLHFILSNIFHFQFPIYSHLNYR